MIAPTEPTDVKWADELLDDLEAPLSDAQIRLVLDPEVFQLLDRLEQAPRRDKIYERVTRDQIDPIPIPHEEEGVYRDATTGRIVVYEDHPSVTRGEPPYWARETAFPPGAITAGELARLNHLLWKGVERLADLADAGALSKSQRQDAMQLVEAADHLDLRMRVLAWEPDPEQAQALKQTAIDILAYGRPRPREVNRARGFLDRKHDWSELLVETPTAKLTRGQLRDLYMKNAQQIVDGIKGYDALVLLGVGKNRTILRRHGAGGKNIRITKAYGIEDPHSLEYWANRRLVELHRVIGPRTDVVWVDLDPKGDGQLRKLVRDVVPYIEDVIRAVFPEARIQAWDSGKRGVHVEGYLPRKVSADKARKHLRAMLDETFAGDDRLTTGIAKPGQIRLDVTTLKRTGSVRAPYSPTVEGRIKRPL